MNKLAPDHFVVHAQQLLTMQANDSSPVGLLEHAGLLVEQGSISWIGPWSERPKAAKKNGLPTMETGVLMPGWVECHAQLFVAGSPQKNAPLALAKKTRRASSDKLAAALLQRTFEFVRRGIVHIEVIAGLYSCVEDALKMIDAIETARQEAPCSLGVALGIGYALPQDTQERKTLLHAMTTQLLTMVEQERISSCAILCDPNGCTVEETRHILELLHAHNLPIHLEGGAHNAPDLQTLAAPYAHASILARGTLQPQETLDHARIIGEPTGLITRGTILDTDHILAKPQALSTGLHPVYSMTHHPGLVVSMSCALHNLSVEEALYGITRGAAYTLCRDDLGVLSTGLTAHLVMFDCPSIAHISYALGADLVEGVVTHGEFVYWTETQDME